MDFFVFGDEDVVLSFKFIGIQGKVIESNNDLIDEFSRVVNGDYGEIGVLIITEKLSLAIEDKITEHQLSGHYPLIVEIPDIEGHLEGRKSMLDLIRKAIGLSV